MESVSNTAQSTTSVLASPYGEEGDFSQPSPPGTDSSHKESVLGHLDELRQRILVSLGAWLVGTIIAFTVVTEIIEWLKAATPVPVHFVQLSPGEALLVSMRVAFVGGTLISAPVLIYQFLRFVIPGLLPKERMLLVTILFTGTFLAAAGIAFSYYLVLPNTLGWLVGYGQQIAETQISIEMYVNFCLGLLALTGLMFELPMVLFLLAWFRFIHSSLLISRWRQVLVIIFAVSAILTPSQDPFTMLLIAGALTGLYAISILPIRILGR